jgi:hypothetical protein
MHEDGPELAKRICGEVPLELIARFVQRELEGEEKDSVAGHLANCRSCIAVANELGNELKGGKDIKEGGIEQFRDRLCGEVPLELIYSFALRELDSDAWNSVGLHFGSCDPCLAVLDQLCDIVRNPQIEKYRSRFCSEMPFGQVIRFAMRDMNEEEWADGLLHMATCKHCLRAYHELDAAMQDIATA